MFAAQAQAHQTGVKKMLTSDYGPVKGLLAFSLWVDMVRFGDGDLFLNRVSNLL